MGSENETNTLQFLDDANELAGKDVPSKEGDGVLGYIGGAVKAMGGGKIGGYLVRWGDEGEVDFYGDFFTPKTYLGARDGDGVDTTIHHGQPLRYFNSENKQRVMDEVAAMILPPVKTKRDDIGLFAEVVLDMAEDYQEMVYEMVENGELSWSSGAVGHLVRSTMMENGANRIDQWIIGEAALTPTPAEPRLGRIATMRSLFVNANASDEHPEAGADAEKTGAHAGVSQGVADGKGKNATDLSQTMEDETMDENENSVQIDYDRIEGAFTNALKASGLLDKPQPLGHVTQDETDNAASDPALKPYKHIGEQLLDVVAACRPGSPPPARLLAAHKATAKAVSGLSETVPADGGFLVQTDLQQQLLMPDHEMNKVLSRIPANRRIRISNNANGTTINGIDETSRATGSRWGGVRGYWLSEGDQKTGSKPKFRQINLKLNKVAALVYATDEVLADASQLRTVVGESAREELAFLTEDAIIEGTGAGMPQGILNSPGLVTVPKETGQAAATVVANNIIKMWARRWTRAMDYVWFVNQDVTPQLHGLNLPVGTGGALVYMPAGGLSGLPYGTLYGAPVIEIEYASTLGTVGDVILASMGSYVLADKGDVQEASSMHVRFEYDEQVFRFVYRVDGQTANHSALTPFKGTNTVSPFVALATRA